MKKVPLLLLYFFSTLFASAQKSKIATYIGFQAGVVAPIQNNHYAIATYKMGLPSFSYAASIENRFTINYKLNFSLQYSISYFNIVQKNLEKHIADFEAKQQIENDKKSKLNANFSLNSIYKINKCVGIIGGIGLARPLNLMDHETVNKKLKYTTSPANKYTDKFIPTLNPFFIIGIENSCTVFRKNLIYSIQYNIGFMPNRSLPIQDNHTNGENKYMHGVNIGLKYKY